MTTDRKRRSAQVPGQFLGYSLQTTRATVRLLQAAPGSSVSVEVLDDVAMTTAEGDTTVEQSKSVGTTNPVADRSVEFWKTLANWVQAVESGQIDPATTTFEIFVSKKRTGRIAQSFHAAATAMDATAVIAAAQAVLWGAPPKYAAREKVATTLRPYVECFFTAKDGVAARIVERLSLVFGSGSSHSDLVALLRGKIISDEMLDVVAQQMLGWVKKEIDSRIEQAKSAVLHADDFLTELSAFVRKVDRFAILNSFAPQPDKTKVDLEFRGRTYVRQLDIIGADYDSKLAAANDYLRASIDRSVWAAKGLVHRSSFDTFEEALTRAWTAKRDIVAVQAKGEPPDTCGRLLYSECSLVQPPLEGRTVPPHFTPGCYHALADQLAVGWHPDFKSVLASDDPGKGPAV
jgi:hypothetical protein